MGTNTKYWKGLEELHSDPEFVTAKENEFAEPIPADQFLGDEKLASTSTNRRDFLKFLGFSVGAASLAACETPVAKAIPYVSKPEEIVPGEANWYASSFFDGQDYSSVLVKTREGRPIKIEGNELCPITKGVTNARTQASVLSLYDQARITGPQAKKNGTWNEKASWKEVDSAIAAKLAEIGTAGGNIRILSSTVISPSTKQVFADFTAKYPNTRHVTYDAVSYHGLIKANKDSFGLSGIPRYNFENAGLIISIGADFLGTWLNPTEFAAQYAKNRKVSKDKPFMSKHVQFESNLSLTGSNADIRIPIKPSQYGTTAIAIYNAVAKMLDAPQIKSVSLPFDSQIEQLGDWLVKQKGNSLVVCGSNDPAVQMIVNAINSLCDNYENSIDLNNPLYIRQGNDEAFAELVKEMQDGKVAALITYNTNPAYTASSLGFADAYAKVGLKISFADRRDETAELADFICPDHHYLESWNDANPAKGLYALAQPTINPVFSSKRYEGTRCAQESLLLWSGAAETNYYNYIRKYWETNIYPKQSAVTFFESFWNNSLRDGVVKITAAPAAGPAPAAVAETTAPQTPKDIAQCAEAIINTAKGGAWEAVIYEKVGIGNGTQANNPWLQELPDPITKVTWDNYITMSPVDMEKAGYSQLRRGDYMGNVVTLTINKKSVNLPVYPQPGQMPGTIGVALGYGRKGAGKVADGVGADVYPFLQTAGGYLGYLATDATIADTTEKHEFASTQTHNTLMGRDIVKETTLSEYSANPHAGNPHKELHTHKGHQPVESVTLWDDFSRPGHHWGLSIDLNSCIGCGACVVACNAENNVHVVGKTEVRKSREMHWIRIDRYYSSDMTKEIGHENGLGKVDMYSQMEIPTAENPKVVFQPIMCQHCNHAPCETVCPVIATSHSDEGLNHMTYNRCVGTRYCANNCPYKVRRFNWFNYIGNPDFAEVNPAQNDLGRMVLNPDVVVRGRGVMEKCSMCIQRIQAGKLTAKREGRPLKEGDINTACAQTCPTNAIIFGDYSDKESKLVKSRTDERAYEVLEEVGVKPSVFYLTKVRHIEPSAAAKAEAHATEATANEHHN